MLVHSRVSAGLWFSIFSFQKNLDDEDQMEEMEPSYPS
jgi:hypothetical protein